MYTNLPVATAHTLALVTTSWNVLYAEYHVPPRYPGCCGHPFITG